MIDCEFTGLNIERDRLCLVKYLQVIMMYIIQLDKDNFDAPNLKEF